MAWGRIRVSGPDFRFDSRFYQMADIAVITFYVLGFVVAAYIAWRTNRR